MMAKVLYNGDIQNEVLKKQKNRGGWLWFTRACTCTESS